MIVALGPAKITGVDDLVTATSTHRPGDRVTATVIRDGKRLSLPLTLAKEPSCGDQPLTTSAPRAGAAARRLPQGRRETMRVGVGLSRST